MQQRLRFLESFICIGAILLAFGPITFADDETVNENNIFTGNDTVVSQDQVTKDNVDNELKENHLGFTGEISYDTTYCQFNRAYDMTGKIQDNDVMSNLMSANLFMDVRLKQGVKGFLSAEIDYYSALNPTTKELLDLESDTNTNSDYTDTKLKELFLDTNLQNKIYFRFGKQVLQWGQGYFWNPSDLLNIQKKSFTDMNNIREGTYGIKTQIPFGVKQNIYLFTDMYGTNDPSTVAQALKYEFLVGNTEMSVSALAKEGEKPVYGCDFTSQLGDVDLRGEMSLTSGSDCSRINYDTLDNETLSGVISRICLGFTKKFDQADIKDRIALVGEFYYNQAGYDNNIIKKVMESGGTTAQISLLNSYSSFEISKYYMALFSSINKFCNSDTSLNFNAIMNLVDHSSLLITGLSYAPALNNFTVDFDVGYYLGDKYTETRLLGERFYGELKMTVKF